MRTLFDPLPLGDLTLKNRVVMAPLTRMRAASGNVPVALNAEYYAQRAGAGLIISEATQISQQGQGYPATPGIYTQAQVEGWKQVTDAVRQAGGVMFLQLWHVGRVSHPSHQPDGGLPVAPSAIAAKASSTYSAAWKPVALDVPRTLETHEIPGLIADYAHAAGNARAAGFDGVEVHGANGYLLDQFLHSGSNQRTDAYGGGIEHRARLLLEAVDAVVKVWGAGRVGVRLSPYGTFNDMHDEDPVALFTYVLRQLDARKVAYVHVIEPRATAAGGSDAVAEDAPSTSALFKNIFHGVFISAGGYDRASALQAVESSQADAVAFGRLFISNPDLVEKLRDDMALTHYDRSTFYGGDEKGYTDYPASAQHAA